MAVSTIKASNAIQSKSGSKSVPSGTVTSLDTIDASDTNAYYLVISAVTPTSTLQGKTIFSRISGAITQAEFRNGVSAQSINILKGNGAVYTLQCNHDAGSNQTIDYWFKAIKLT